MKTINPTIIEHYVFPHINTTWQSTYALACRKNLPPKVKDIPFSLKDIRDLAEGCISTLFKNLNKLTNNHPTTQSYRFLCQRGCGPDFPRYLADSTTDWTNHNDRLIIESILNETILSMGEWIDPSIARIGTWAILEGIKNDVEAVPWGSDWLTVISACFDYDNVRCYMHTLQDIYMGRYGGEPGKKFRDVVMIIIYNTMETQQLKFIEHLFMFLGMYYGDNPFDYLIDDAIRRMSNPLVRAAARHLFEAYQGVDE